jgi:hypothetical protein
MRLTSLFLLLTASLVACSSDPVTPVDGGGTDASPDALPDAPPPSDGGLDATDSGPNGPNIVFVTTSAFDAKTIASPSNADKLCNDAAKAKGVTGTYAAWIAAQGTDATTRLGTARGWVRLDGKPVADTIADLAAGKLLYPPNVDEGGKTVGASARVLTGARGDGKDVETCASWTDFTSAKSYSAGAAGAEGELWTNRYTEPCNLTGNLAPHLYCFGIDRTVAITKPVRSGRLVFLSKGTLDGNAGISAMDALCNSEATSAGLGGSRTYKALVATESATGASRFANVTGPISRPDGVVVATTAAALFDASQPLGAAVNVNADGVTYDRSANGPWTGSNDMTKTGGAACTGWAQTSPGAIAGSSGAIDGERFGGVVTTCAEKRPVYCLQE